MPIRAGLSVTRSILEGGGRGEDTFELVPWQGSASGRWEVRGGRRRKEGERQNFIMFESPMLPSAGSIAAMDRRDLFDKMVV
jgi:hypothetical protein